MVERDVEQLLRRIEPPRESRCLVESQEAGGQHCVILEHCRRGADSPAEGSATQMTVHQVKVEKSASALGRRRDPVGSVQGKSRFRQSRDGQPVPGRHHFVVAARLWTLSPGGA